MLLTRVSLTTVVLMWAGLAAAPVTVTAYPSLTVTRPVGGEIWSAGGTNVVTWTATDLDGYIFIDLYKGGFYQSFIGYAPATDGSYSWEICPYIGDGADYRVWITGFDALGQPVVGAGTGDFSIADSLSAPPAPTVTVSSPNGGEIWTAGTAQTITWNATDPAGYVYVDLYEGGSYHSFLGYAMMSAGAFDWQICEYFGDGTDYSVRISGQDACGQTIDDFSNASFAVTGSLPPPPAPTVTVTSPNGGENWQAGNVYTITWATTDPAGDVYVDLYQGGQFVTNIAQAPMSDGQIDWTICEYTGDGTDYQIAISGADACGRPLQDFSDSAFTITGSLPSPALTLTSPSGGEAWQAGTLQPITWTAADPSGDCYIYLESFDGPALRDIRFLGVAAMADGQFPWRIGACEGQTPELTYRIYLSYSCPQTPLGATSGAFDLLPAVIPGDFDGNCHVDIADLQHFELCATGAGIPQTHSPFGDADLDHDTDVDQSDFAVLQRCYSGEDEPGDPNCAD